MSKAKLSRQHLLAYSALLLAVTIWSIATVVIKATLDHVPLMSFLFYRFLIVGIIMLPFVWYETQKSPVNLKDLPTLIILGLLGQSGILFIFAGIKYTSAIDAAIIGAIAPLMIIALGHYYYKDKINTKLEIGLILATIGTLFVVFEPALMDNSEVETLTRIFGNLLVILYNFVFALYIILSKKVMGERSGAVSETLRTFGIRALSKKYSPALHTAISFYVALLTFIPLYAAEVLGAFGEYTFKIEHISNIGLAGILYMALLSSIVAYIAFQWGLDNSKVADSGVFTYLGPVITLPAAYFMIGEIPSSIALTGSAIILIGVIIAELRKS